MDRPEEYLKHIARLALTFPGEDKGARATAKALMENPDALYGAYAVAYLVGAYASSCVSDGIELHEAMKHATALLSLLERHLGDLISVEVAEKFKVDYERAMETL